MEPVVKVFAVAATTPLTAMSVTLELGVMEVAVTAPVLEEAPVEKPAVKVPLNLPKLAATGLASVNAAAVAPEAMFEKAAATSLAVMLTLAVKVRPLTVTKSLGLSALNVRTLVSVALPTPPWLIVPMVTEVALVPDAVKSPTLVFAVLEVNRTTLPVAVPVENAVRAAAPAVTVK